MIVCQENLFFFNVLASETRLQIIDLLRTGPMNLRKIAEELGVSVTIVSRHIKLMEKAGIVSCANIPSTHGLQKQCSLVIGNNVVLEFAEECSKFFEIPIGLYMDWQANITCGLATEQRIIGQVDDPRYFADPAHHMARIIWLTDGYLEYQLPNYLTNRQSLTSLQIKMELSSEAPGYNEQWPSDIYFYINGHELGYWTCPGNFGSRKGLLTPEWWGYGTQYGLLKTLAVNKEGSFIDGLRISNTRIGDLDIAFGRPICLRIAVPETAVNRGGLCLLGRGFGNYDQDIAVTMEYELRSG